MKYLISSPCRTGFIFQVSIFIFFILFLLFLNSGALAEDNLKEALVDTASEPTYEKYDRGKYDKYTKKIEQPKDSFEIFNRKMYIFGDRIDRYLINPVVKGYRKITNRPVRESVNNFFTNLRVPVYTVNSVLQGNGKQALDNTSSFIINTTAGGVGLFDIAGNKWDIRRSKEDFGQTMGRYDVPSGPYLFLPILGPSTMRDFPGRIVDKFINPINNARDDGLLDNDSTARTVIAVGTIFSQRDQIHDVLNEVRETSFDPYSTIRSAYLQKRQKDVRDRGKI